ncbi:hypothetical protein G6F35_014732 [Rhizopus arrhizus]|nr:hypothetical protein G6F35_014732 [Rhizopus arrhizus]
MAHRPVQQPAQARPQEVHQQADQQGDGAGFQGAEQAEVQGKVHRVGRDEKAASVRVSAGRRPADTPTAPGRRTRCRGPVRAAACSATTPAGNSRNRAGPSRAPAAVDLPAARRSTRSPAGVQVPLRQSSRPRSTVAPRLWPERSAM